MFLVNSRHHLVTATFESLDRKGPHHQRHTFFRSYGIILQSSLTNVLSSALGFSPHPPVSVYGTVNLYTSPAAFLGSMGSPTGSLSEDVKLISPLGVNGIAF